MRLFIVLEKRKKNKQLFWFTRMLGSVTLVSDKYKLIILIFNC